jgi:hypothetical protein
MLDFTSAHKALLERILEGHGRASPERRRAAFDNAGLAEPLRTLIDKVANHAYKIVDADIAAVRNAGLSEDEIFELVVCAAVGQAARQYDTAMAALAVATEREKYASRDPR